MKESPERNNPNLTKSRLWDMVQHIPKTLQEMDKPIIAAVNGPATGAGMDMASMCDIRLAAESAKFAESYVRMASVPGAGGCWFLPRLVGMPKALELLYTADFVEAAEAKEIGLVNHVYPDDELMEQAYKLATKIAPPRADFGAADQARDLSGTARRPGHPSRPDFVAYDDRAVERRSHGSGRRLPREAPPRLQGQVALSTNHRMQ